MLSMTDQDKFTFHFMDVLSAPILTFSQSWADSIPARLKHIILPERLLYAMQDKELAGDAECVAYIMTRTYESPMSSDWVDIYTHLSCKVAQEHWNQDCWESVSAPKELTDYQKNYLLLPLRKWIYERRRKALKERMKKEVPQKETKEMATPIMETKYEQLTLF